MARTTFTTAIIDGSITTTATLVENFNFVKLGAESIILELPTAASGEMIVVSVIFHYPGRRGVIRIRPAADDTLDTKAAVFSVDEVVIWELRSSMTFLGIDDDTWAVIDAL